VDEDLVISFCHRTKLGLRDHSLALVKYGTLRDKKRVYRESGSLFYSFINILKHRLRGQSVICVIWDNSWTSLALSILAQLSRCHVVYYYHEPGGLGQKLFKGDPAIYAVAASLAESAFKMVATRTVVARRDRLAFGDAFCPLLYDDARPRRRSTSAPLIGFLGARRQHRLYNQFLIVADLLRKQGWEVGFFPSERWGSSTADKFNFLSLCKMVWNVYGVPFNQSGVTGDCFMSGTPMVHSPLEPEKSKLASAGLSIQISLDMKPEEICRLILASSQSRSSIENLQNNEDHEIKSEYGGKIAFEENWLNLFESLKSI
jgi:hypothetical protein